MMVEAFNNPTFIEHHGTKVVQGFNTLLSIAPCQIRCAQVSHDAVIMAEC